MPLSLSACLSGISLAPISLKPESWCGGLRPCHPSSGPAGGSNRVIMPPHLSPLFVLPVLCLLYSLPHLELYLHAPSFSLNRELPSDASTPRSTPPPPPCWACSITSQALEFGTQIKIPLLLARLVLHYHICVLTTSGKPGLSCRTRSWSQVMLSSESPHSYQIQFFAPKSVRPIM